MKKEYVIPSLELFNVNTESVMQSLSAKTSPGMKPIDVVTTPTDEPADIRRHHDVWDDGSEEEEQL
jgi:hypothetical protein